MYKGADKYDFENYLKRTSEDKEYSDLELPNSLLAEILETWKKDQNFVVDKFVMWLSSELRNRFDRDIQAMDEKLALIKATGIKHKELLKETLDEEEKRMSAAFEEYFTTSQNTLAKFNRKALNAIQEAKAPIQQLNNNLSELTSVFTKINCEKFSEILNLLDRLSKVDDRQLHILKKLIKEEQ